MKVIATRSKSMAIAIVSVICFLFLMLFISKSFQRTLALNIVALVIMVPYAIYFFSIPKEIIKLNEKNELILPKNICVPLKDVTDVTYRMMRTRRLSQPKTGTIIITTDNGEYKMPFVSEYEKVGKMITNMVSESKNIEENF